MRYEILSVAKLAKARDCNGIVILRSGVRLTPGRFFFANPPVSSSPSSPCTHTTERYFSTCRHHIDKQEMPSRNSVNKPKGKLQAAHRSNVISKKKAYRANRVVPTRSSNGRYNTDTAPRPTDSKALALYSGGLASTGNGVTTTTLSKKRAKKIERNKRYVAKRNEQLNIDLAVKQEGMDIDMEPQGKRVKPQKPPTTLDKVKEALWAAVEDSTSGDMGLNVLSEGTTIGIQAF